MREISKGHFVYCNDKEEAEYKLELKPKRSWIIINPAINAHMIKLITKPIIKPLSMPLFSSIIYYVMFLMKEHLILLLIQYN